MGSEMCIRDRNYTLNDSTPRVSFVLRHRDMETLRQAANAVKGQLYDYSGTYYVRDNLRGESDELHMTLLPGAENLACRWPRYRVKCVRPILVKKCSACPGRTAMFA